MKQIFNDLFIGWNTARLSRMRYFCYSLLIIVSEFAVMTLLNTLGQGTKVKEVSNSTLIFYSVQLTGVLILCIYSSILILTKRIRDLGITYPFIVALIVTVSDYCFWPLLNALLRADQVNLWSLMQSFTIATIFLFNLYILLGKSKFKK